MAAISAVKYCLENCDCKAVDWQEIVEGGEDLELPEQSEGELEGWLNDVD